MRPRLAVAGGWEVGIRASPASVPGMRQAGSLVVAGLLAACSVPDGEVNGARPAAENAPTCQCPLEAEMRDAMPPGAERFGPHEGPAECLLRRIFCSLMRAPGEPQGACTFGGVPCAPCGGRHGRESAGVRTVREHANEPRSRLGADGRASTTRAHRSQRGETDAGPTRNEDT